MSSLSRKLDRERSTTVRGPRCRRADKSRRQIAVNDGFDLTCSLTYEVAFLVQVLFLQVAETEIEVVRESLGPESLARAEAPSLGRMCAQSSRRDTREGTRQDPARLAINFGQHSSIRTFGRYVAILQHHATTEIVISQTKLEIGEWRALV